jgi:hypothetical protein
MKCFLVGMAQPAPTRRAIRLLLSVALATLLLGCGAGRVVQRGADKYQQADYGGALVDWRYLEEREQDMNDKGRVRYLVYRGLTHYRLFQQSRDASQHAAALHFLARGKSAYDNGSARWLQARTVVEMKDALIDLTGQVPATAQVMVVHLPPPPETLVVPAPAPADGDEDEAW